MNPHPLPLAATSLGQAFAAIIATLIAALAEHARLHPNLAGLIRLTIRHLEATARDFDALVAAHQSPGSTLPPRRRRARISTSWRTAPGLRPKHFHLETERRSAAATPRLSAARRNPSARPRAPP